MWSAAWSLLRKDLQQHVWVSIPAILLTLPAIACAIVVVLGDGGASFVSAGLGVAYYWMPIIVMVLTRRLIAQEYLDGTHRFLMGLPPPAWLRILIKLSLGCALTLLLCLTPVAVVLAMASLRELVTFGWFFQLLLQCAIYLLAWFTLAAAISHLGRYRYWVWLSLLILSSWFAEGAGWSDGLWLAPLSDSFDATRSFIPWDGLLVGTIWFLGAGALCVFLAAFRGGSLPAALYGPASTRDQIAGAAAVIGLLLAVEVLPEVGEVERVGWERFPAVSERPIPIRITSPRVRPHGEAIAAAFGRLDAILNDPLEMSLILVPPGPTAPPPLTSMGVWATDADQVIFRVHHDASDGLVCDAVQGWLTARSQERLSLDPDRGWLAAGVALRVAAPQDGGLADLRAGYAMQQGLTRAQLDRWDDVRRAVGDDVAAGVAAVGIEVLFERLGEEKAKTLLTGALLHQRGDVDQLDATFRDAWYNRLHTVAFEQKAAVAALPVLSANLTRAPETDAVRITWDVAPRTTEAVLEIRPISPIRQVHFTGAESYPLDASRGAVQSWAPPQHPVDVTVMMYVPALQGVIVSGWERLK